MDVMCTLLFQTVELFVHMLGDVGRSTSDGANIRRLCTHERIETLLGFIALR